ncbi:hypothetical protein E3P99_02540 [Wallemia hederae]|uniref:Uncharacterized protein n=1 Tax=Wallemia hederae TaxID=1540922 RepID=A0A4T0FJX7_9BASI|nr:hypothetical protein E3P99_02540 [Wallemia hederae]
MFANSILKQVTRAIHTGSKSLMAQGSAQASAAAATHSSHANKQAIFESLGKVEFNGNKNAHTVSGH